MDPLFVILFFVLALPVGYLLLHPWGQGSELQTTELEQRRSVLLARKEAILAALRELEVDYRGGKVSEEDYRLQKEQLMEEGAAVLRELEALEAKLRQVTGARKPAAAAEAGHAAAQTSPASPKGESSDDPIEALLQRRKATAAAVYIGFCPNCGAPLRAGQRYCAYCGHELPAQLRRKPVAETA